METTAVQNREGRKRVFACVLLFFLLSFCGWVFEKLYFWFAFGVNADRGFLTLPFCTVYGSALLLIRVTLGFSWKEETSYPYNLLRFVLYAFAAGLLASAVELSTGLFFENVFHARLWTYRGYAHVYRDYICLPVSVGWGLSIAVGMAAVWAPLERVLMRAPMPLLAWSSFLLILSVSLDFLLTAFF